MQNKKVIMIIIVFFAIGAFILTYFFIVHNKKSAQQVSQNNLPSEVCGYASDQDAYNKVIENGDKSICNCINDISLKNICVETAVDRDYYVQALNDLDAEKCELITDEIGKESCILVVQDGTAYIKNREENIENEVNAVPDFEKIRQEHPENVVNLLELVMSYSLDGYNNEVGEIDENMIARSFAILDDAKKLEPNNPKIYSTEGNLYVIIKKYDKALEFYNKSIALDPNDLEAYVNRARTLHVLKMNDEAIVDFEKARTLDVNKIYTDMTINSELCKLYSEKNDREKIIDRCTMVINGNSDEIQRSEAQKILDSL